MAAEGVMIGVLSTAGDVLEMPAAVEDGVDSGAVLLSTGMLGEELEVMVSVEKICEVNVSVDGVGLDIGELSVPAAEEIGVNETGIGTRLVRLSVLSEVTGVETAADE